MDKALAKWKRLPESERKPGAVQIERRGGFDPKRSILPPPGGIVLRTFTRSLDWDVKSLGSAPKKMIILSSGITVDAEPNRDFVWLTEAEWKALVPANPSKGTTIAIPKCIANRIFRFHLRDNSFCLGSEWSLEQVRSGELALTVEGVTEKDIQMRLTGSALLASDRNLKKALTGYDVALAGVLNYDRKKKAFDRFDVVALGEFWGQITGVVNGVKPGPYHYPLGIAFELVKSDSSADRIPPRGTRLVTGSSESASEYFKGALGVVRSK
jgi:hypothetical protein